MMNKHEKCTKLWAIANANMYISCRQNRIDKFCESVLLYSGTLCNIVQNGINIISVFSFATRNTDLCFVRKYMQIHIYTCSCVLLEQRKEGALRAY